MSQVTREHFDQDMVPCYAPMAMVPVRGEGCTLWDQAGHAYLDLAGGIAVNCLGHCHPVLVDAIAQQSQRLWHVSNIMTNEPALALAGKLKAHSFADRVFFCNSGAEANEAAFKLARRAAVNLYAPEKSEIIAFKQGFHGRTFFTVSVGGQACYSDGFGPKPQEIRHLPYNDLAAVSAAMSSRTCAVVVELIQGEGGVIPVDLNFLKGLRELCDRHNALLIVDEVQTGIGRTGHFYAYQATGVIPDILTSAKSLGGGFPIAAMLTTESCAKHFTPGTHGSTYGGNPLACAVANAVVDVVSEPSFLAKVQQSGAALVQALNQLNEQYHLFQTVRGQGLLVGAELNQQWQGRAGEIMAAAAQQGLLMLVAGKNVLRFTPPLIITPAEIEQAIGKLARAITELQEKAIA